MPTRSLLDAPLGVLEPQILHLPPGVVSLVAAEEVIELADAYRICDGHPLDESQRHTLRAGLGEREDGSWAAATVADFEPRQNGKNDTIAARELGGVILFGEELIIHTAHEAATATESFLRLLAVFDAWDDLSRRVMQVRKGKGDQAILFKTGQRLIYRARTGGSSRGFAKADLVVYDEAQHAQPEHVAASGPARLVNPNSQAWYSGSGGLSTSVVAWRLRRRALAGGDGRFAYVEHTAEDVTLDGDARIVSQRPANVLDPVVLAKANPAYGRRNQHETYESLYGELGPELFGRECACIWDQEPSEAAPPKWQVIPETGWKDCHRPHEIGALRFALDVDVNEKGQEWCSIGCSDGRHLGVVDVSDPQPGTDWVVPAVAARASEVGEILIPRGPADKLIDPLERAGVEVRRVTADEFVRASMAFVDAVSGGEVSHLDQPRLNRAAATVARKDIGDGAWRFSRRSSVGDVSPITAVMLARWAAGSLEGGPSVYEDRGLASL